MLSFVKSDNKLNTETKIFHSEPVFGGEFHVTDKNEDDEAPVDFELLFNAVLSNPKEIIAHLNQ